MRELDHILLAIVLFEEQAGDSLAFTMAPLPTLLQAEMSMWSFFVMLHGRHLGRRVPGIVLFWCRRNKEKYKFLKHLSESCSLSEVSMS